MRLLLSTYRLSVSRLQLRWQRKGDPAPVSFCGGRPESPSSKVMVIMRCRSPYGHGRSAPLVQRPAVGVTRGFIPTVVTFCSPWLLRVVAQLAWSCERERCAELQSHPWPRKPADKPGCVARVHCLATLDLGT